MAKTTTNYAFPYPEDADPVDVAGDIQALAEDIDTNLGEIIADTVGTMVTSNTENGITVEYDDNDNTLDFDVADFDVILSGDVSGSATVTNLASINISASVADNSHNHIASNITDFESAVEAVTESFVTIDLPSGTDPVATIYNDTLTISESNGILVSGSGSNTVDISTNATPLNTASALVSRDSERTFDITAVDFDTSASATTQVGRLAWEDGEGTLKVNLKGGNVDLDIGQENVVLCYNGSGSAMSIGDVVYIQGAQGQRPDITLASASSESSSNKTLGIVAEAIGAGNEGFVTTFGVVKNVNTFGITEGAALWLSATAGEFTETPPETPDHLVFVGYCLKASSGAGRIFVEPQNGYEIEELHNVLITTPADGDALIYNSASSIWINEDFDERAQDAAASMITGGSHTNITVTYNDGTNTLDLTGSATVTDEQVQDAIAPLFTHAFHTNITATYDDANDRIVLVGSAAGGGGSAISTDVALSNSWWLGV